VGPTSLIAEHVDADSSSMPCVLFENPRFATVEKFFGAGARIARSSDPRR
jgi:hypothetical protein